MKIENTLPPLGTPVTDLDVKRITHGEWKTLYQTWLHRHALSGRDLSKTDF